MFYLDADAEEGTVKAISTMSDEQLEAWVREHEPYRGVEPPPTSYGERRDGAAPVVKQNLTGEEQEQWAATVVRPLDYPRDDFGVRRDCTCGHAHAVDRQRGKRSYGHVTRLCSACRPHDIVLPDA